MKKPVMIMFLQLLLSFSLVYSVDASAGSGRPTQYRPDLKRLEEQKKEEARRLQETFQRHIDQEKKQECEIKCTKVSYLRYMIVEVLKYLKANPYKVGAEWHKHYLKFVLETSANYNKYCKLTKFVKFVQWVSKKLLVIFHLDKPLNDELYNSKKPLLPEKILKIREKVLNFFIKIFDRSKIKLPENCIPDDGNNGGGGNEPPVDQPPVDQPPVDQPPVDQPPVDQPPVDQPPVDQPPVDQPPVDQPPVDQPPVDQPPVDQPPVDQPPVDQPPVDQPPVDQPPVDQPPVDQPPVDQPPVDQPPVDQPPVDQPPVDQPPVDQPPVDQPPVDQPPVDQPPVDQPPVDQPPVDQPPSNGGQSCDPSRPDFDPDAPCIK